MFDLEYQLKVLPDKPGVYIMKNNLGEVIYVGKAKVLKNRVRQYFQKSKNHSQKVKAMVNNISEFEYIVTDSEIEALILECNLIKEYRPRYNILLKDDKQYPFIKITINEEFPRVFITRKHLKDGGKYFGPYTDKGALNQIMDLIRKMFPIRKCNKKFTSQNLLENPCLNYHIGICKGPCIGMISSQQYLNIINQIINLLSGKDKNIINELTQNMNEASINLDFEKAAMYRDRIKAINIITQKQKVVLINENDEDFINIYQDEKDSCIQIFFLRDGKVVGREHFILENTIDLDSKEIVYNFIKGFYSDTTYIPKIIYVSGVNEENLLMEYLTIIKGSKVLIKTPLKGEKKSILSLVRENAKITLQQFKTKFIMDKEINKCALEELREILNLNEIPVRIEAYDISNIQGVDSVGGMVVFENGKSKPSDYRRFKIKTVTGPNDYASMKEVLQRRFNKGLTEVKSIGENNLNLSKGKFCFFPDLILMDGGKGQVNIALEVLNDLNINIPVCGMVKDDKHRTRGLIYNNIEVDIKTKHNLIQLITKIQDEVHRFAITYHRTLKTKNGLISVLDNIKGVGSKRKVELLKKFKGINGIKKATYDELLQTPTIDSKTAKNIINYFKNNY